MVQLHKVEHRDIELLQRALQQTPGKVVFAPSADALHHGVPANEVFRGPFREIDCFTGMAIMGEDATSPLQPILVGLNGTHHIVVHDGNNLKASGWKHLRKTRLHAFIPETYFE